MLRTKLGNALFCIVLASTAPLLPAQNTLPAQGSPAPSPGGQIPPATKPRNILGAVTAIRGETVTVQQEGANAGSVSLTVTPQTRLLRTVPGETSLKNATPMPLSDLAVGDRVLIRPASEGVAGILVAMKQGDIRDAHAQESADWQQRGVSGIVDSLDTGAGTVTLRAAQGNGAASGNAPGTTSGAAPIVIHTTAATVVRRYAADSTAFADTHKASLTDIHPGDQLRARGAKDATGAGVTAEEIVAGSFRNIAGTVVSADPTANTLAVLDLATKKPITLQLETSTQLRKLPPEMAARMAHRQGAAPEAGAAGQGDASQARTGGRAHGDMAALLQRAPSITPADLKKGDAVMVVASGPGTTQPRAITVIAGVEALLQGSPEASAGLFSASWNLGSGEGAGAEGGAPR